MHAVNRSATFPEFRFGGGLPLEEAFARNQTPDPRPPNGVERHKHLVRQKCQCQKDSKVGCEEVLQSVAGDSRSTR
jgi:hypothetical protein